MQHSIFSLFNLFTEEVPVEDREPRSLFSHPVVSTNPSDLPFSAAITFTH